MKKLTLLVLAVMMSMHVMAQEQNILVAYFSATGATRAAAEQ